MLAIVDEGILSHVPGRGAYMPVITPLADGTYMACQHVGRALGSPDNHIEVLRSTDGGKTWANAGSIHGGIPNDGWAYRGPEIHKLPDGRLLMTATRFEARHEQLFDPESEALQRPEMLLFWSDDYGRSWSPPQVVPVDLPPEKYTWNGAGRLLQMAPDRWLYFLETWKPEGYAGPPDQKSALVVSRDRGQTWGEFTVVADDPAGQSLYWDQMCCILPDGRIYDMFWTHHYGTSDDFVNHWSVSSDAGRTWSTPQPTNLRGQVCTPIALADGRVAAIYNDRHEPQGIRIALSDDLSHFGTDNQATVFDAGAEAKLGGGWRGVSASVAPTAGSNFLAEHMQIGFGKPSGHLEQDGSLLTYFWCTANGVTHTRWVRLRA